MPSKSSLGTSPTCPALRTARQRPARAATIEAKELQCYLCPQSGPFVHLLVLEGGELLGRWVCPVLAADTATTGLRPRLWMQVSSALGEALPAPDTATAIRQGTCCLLGKVASSPAALPASKLLLRFLNPEGKTELYSLTQLRVGGSAWLLNKVNYPLRQPA